MGLFWVLSWMKIECIDFPKFSDEVKIQTWGKKHYKLYSIRDYLLVNSDSKIICKGTSAWLLLDSKTLRPKILPELFPDIKMFESKDALTDLPKKLIPSRDNEIIYSSQIRYSDLDLNQHANNAKYIELMLDCYDVDFHKNHTLKTLTISFNSETKYGDNIQLRKGIEVSNSLTHFIEAKNLKSEKIVFQASLEWS
ncbi:MAG: thioesterase, partial [Ignavibacteriaceae bacterium]|nr:thioesterase [Ignavibacteriaceae bacterium]